jgi:hypothetical protein
MKSAAWTTIDGDIEESLLGWTHVVGGRGGWVMYDAKVPPIAARDASVIGGPPEAIGAACSVR